MNLAQKQRVFTVRIATFLLKIHELGYEVSLGEAWRPTETANLYAKEGRGISNSLHCLRLALDINLFKDNKAVIRREDYIPAGELWESMSGPEIQCTWGGRFGDCCHFSISHNGVK